MSDRARRVSCDKGTVPQILKESTLETETSPEDRNGPGGKDEDTVDMVDRDGSR